MTNIPAYIIAPINWSAIAFMGEEKGAIAFLGEVNGRSPVGKEGGDRCQPRFSTA